MNMFEDIVLRFGVQAPEACVGITIPGSPERCLERRVVRDAAGSRWLVEKLFPGQGAQRERIAAAMDVLAQAGLDEIPAYCNAGGSYVLCAGGAEWMVQPYVAGDVLPQPDYIDDEGRGVSLAGFLVRMLRRAHVVSGVDASFCLPEYVAELLHVVGDNKPEILPHCRRVEEALAPFFEAWDELPIALAHGDYHPLNVMWRGQDVLAVIDWDFCGMRPELYDTANLLGCVGIEDPAMLGAGLAGSFLRSLREGEVLTVANGRWLYPMVLGMRFAWLSEWLRRNDREMIGLELRYMDLLMNQRNELERVWGIC